MTELIYIPSTIVGECPNCPNRYATGYDRGFEQAKTWLEDNKKLKEELTQREAEAVHLHELLRIELRGAIVRDNMISDLKTKNKRLRDELAKALWHNRKWNRKYRLCS